MRVVDDDLDRRRGLRLPSPYPITDAAAGADGIGQIVGSGLQQPDDLQQVRFSRAVRTDQDVEGRQFKVDPLRPERQQVSWP